MKVILGIILLIVVVSFAGILLPAIIGILLGISMIKSGNIIGGLIAIVIGVGINVAIVAGSLAESGTPSGHVDDVCPYCGSADTDGNHCESCGEDY